MGKTIDEQRTIPGRCPAYRDSTKVHLPAPDGAYTTTRGWDPVGTLCMSFATDGFGTLTFYPSPFRRESDRDLSPPDVTCRATGECRIDVVLPPSPTPHMPCNRPRTSSFNRFDRPISTPTISIVAESIMRDRMGTIVAKVGGPRPPF